jgi:predicted transcriptional regulator
MKHETLSPALTPLKPKTKKEIASEMDINLRTLQRKLKKLGLDIPRGLIFPEQQRLIYQELGWTAPA